MGSRRQEEGVGSRARQRMEEKRARQADCFRGWPVSYRFHTGFIPGFILSTPSLADCPCVPRGPSKRVAMPPLGAPWGMIPVLRTWFHNAAFLRCLHYILAHYIPVYRVIIATPQGFMPVLYSIQDMVSYLRFHTGFIPHKKHGFIPAVSYRFHTAPSAVAVSYP